VEEAAGNKAGKSAIGIAKLVRYLGQVVVQDALELVDVFPDTPLHNMLLCNSVFQYAHPSTATSLAFCYARHKTIIFDRNMDLI
jgi:hypothetical protein